MAEVETLSNGKHALEDLDMPIKAKFMKSENGHTNGSNNNGNNGHLDLEDNNSTSAATAGDSSSQLNAKGDNSISNKYEFSESETGENSNCDLATNGDESSRVLDEETTESNNGLLNVNHAVSLNNSNSKNNVENSVDNYGDEDEGSEGSDEEVDEEDGSEGEDGSEDDAGED